MEIENKTEKRKSENHQFIKYNAAHSWIMELVKMTRIKMVNEHNAGKIKDEC